MITISKYNFELFETEQTFFSAGSSLEMPSDYSDDTWAERDWILKYSAFLKRLNIGEKIVVTVIMIFTVVGNLLVLLTTWRVKYLHQANKYFVACLAVADFLVGILLAPLRLHQLFLDSDNEERTQSIHLCRFMVWIDNFALQASILTLAFISYDRYLKISKPLHYHLRMSTCKSLKMIFTIWLLPTVFATYAATPHSGSLGIVLMYSYYDYCPAGDGKPNRLFYLLVSLTFFSVTIVIMVMYALVFVIAHKRHKSLTNGELGHQVVSAQNQRSVFLQDLKVVRMLCIVVGLFVFCWFPFVIFNLLQLYHPNLIDQNSESLSYQYSINIFSVVINLLPLLNSMCNPIIYACLDEKYKRGFKSFLQGMCRGKLQRQQSPSGVELRPSS